MKQGQKRGFTLIELLVVISIIGILASLLAPALSHAKTMAKIAQAKTEIKGLEGVINQYYSTYGHYPTSQHVRKDGVSNFNPDYTYGTYNTSKANDPSFYPKGPNNPVNKFQIPTTPPPNVQTNNSEVIAILMDIDRTPGPNFNKKGNPENKQAQVLLNAKMSSSTNAAGVGPDFVYRDPWGSPYIITMDLNYDNSCRDGFYRSDAVTDPKRTGKGLKGLISGGMRDTWEVRSGMVVWSLGPDKMADPTQAADAGRNKDNILSWQ
jgi:type II secretion system protein G